jgi:hypothetical protein
VADDGESTVADRKGHPEARLIKFVNQKEREISKLRRRKRELLESDAPKGKIKLIEARISNEMWKLNARVATSEKQ